MLIILYFSLELLVLERCAIVILASCIVLLGDLLHAYDWGFFSH